MNGLPVATSCTKNTPCVPDVCRQDAAKRAGSPGRDVDRYYTEQQAKRGNPEGTYIGAYAGPDQFTGSRVDHILAASGKLPTASGGDTGFVQVRLLQKCVFQ